MADRTSNLGNEILGLRQNPVQREVDPVRYVAN